MIREASCQESPGRVEILQRITVSVIPHQGGEGEVEDVELEPGQVLNCTRFSQGVAIQSDDWEGADALSLADEGRTWKFCDVHPNAPISRKALEKLNAIGFHGPRDSDAPEITRTIEESQTHARLKKVKFSLTAHADEEFGQRYTVYDLAYYPGLALHTREGCRGPVAVLEIQSILEDDLSRLPEFMQRLESASKALNTR